MDAVSLGSMNHMLSQVVSNGTGKRAKLEGHEVGGKTGTTQSYKDAWFIGYTAHYVAGVWVGNDDNSPTKRVTGGSLPTKIWKAVMTAAHEGLSPLPLPGQPPEPEPDYSGDSWALDDLFSGAGQAEERITSFFQDIFGNRSGSEGGNFDRPVQRQRQRGRVQDDNR